MLVETLRFSAPARDGEKRERRDDAEPELLVRARARDMRATDNTASRMYFSRLSPIRRRAGFTFGVIVRSRRRAPISGDTFYRGRDGAAEKSRGEREAVCIAVGETVVSAFKPAIRPRTSSSPPSLPPNSVPIGKKTDVT